MTAAVRTLSGEDSHKLLQYLLNDHTTKRRQRLCCRNYVMACIMLEAGLRVGELVQLKVSHLWFGDSPVTTLVVTGDIAKNHRRREIPVSSYLSNAIRFLREDFWFGIEPYADLNSFTYEEGRPNISTRQVERIIENAGMMSLNRPVNPHMLRHTFATRLSRVTSIRTVQLLLGHNNLSSTQIYTHPDAEDLRSAINAVEGGRLESQARADRIDGALY